MVEGDVERQAALTLHVPEIKVAAISGARPELLLSAFVVDASPSTRRHHLDPNKSVVYVAEQDVHRGSFETPNCVACQLGRFPLDRRKRSFGIQHFRTVFKRKPEGQLPAPAGGAKIPVAVQGDRSNNTPGGTRDQAERYAEFPDEIDRS
jgi:hypothetical protein